jgi:hypothetical protein
MRAILFCLLLALAAPALGTSAGRAQETRYFEELPDLPVMAGLSEAQAAGVAFDKPGGRILTLYAYGPAEPAEVQRFYAETLPALGWQRAGEAAWVRAGERLALEIDTLGGETVARFTLAPE